jgi:hypothetical protein
MTDLTLLATIKDAQGHDLETVEIPVDGILPPNGGTFVGMLQSDPVPEGNKRPKPNPNAAPPEVMTTYTFEKRAAADPELQLRWISGVQVPMKTKEFANANIQIVQLRAIPDEDAAEVVRSEK